jgi:hypothetical protein
LVVVVKDNQLKQIVDEINSSHKMTARKNCPASTDGYDVIVHYTNGRLDRTFTALGCAETVTKQMIL